jgi:hypothetical protein
MAAAVVIHCPTPEQVMGPTTVDYQMAIDDRFAAFGTSTECQTPTAGDGDGPAINMQVKLEKDTGPAWLLLAGTTLIHGHQSREGAKDTWVAWIKAPEVVDFTVRYRLTVTLQAAVGMAPVPSTPVIFKFIDAVRSIVVEAAAGAAKGAGAP